MRLTAKVLLATAGMLILISIALSPVCGGELGASEELNLTSSTDREWGQRTGVDTAGNFHLVHYFSDDSSYEVRYSKLSPKGDVLYAISGIEPSGIDGAVQWMEIAVDGSGSSHIVFSLRLGADDADDIFYTQISSTGSILVPAKRIFTSANNSELPHIDTDGNDRPYIVWEEGGGSPGIYWMKMSAAGAVLLGPLRVSDPLGINGDVARPRIGVDGSGNSYIVWQQKDNGLSRWEIHYTAISTSGGVDVDPVSVVSSSLYDVMQVHADLDGGSKLHISCVINNNAMYSLVDPDGTVQVSQQTIADPVIGEALAPDICVDDSGDAYTAYMQRDNPSSNYNIYFRMRPAEDGFWGSSIQLDPGNVSSSYPRMASGSAGIGVAYDRGNDIFWSLVSEEVVNTSNSAPFAVLSASATEAGVNQTVSFDGSASYDPDAEDSVEEFWFKWGDDSDTGWINSSSAEHFYSYPGTYDVNLWVKDSFGKESEAPDSVTITVSDNQTSNQPPEAVLVASAQEVDLGDVVTFDATSSSDPDGYVAEYYYDFGDSKTTGWVDQGIKSHKYLEAGTYTATLKVKDDLGMQSGNTASVVVVVSKQNVRPTAVIESIRPSLSKEGQEVEFSGYGLDDDGQITGYEWKSNKDGVLSTNAVFVTKTLSIGLHSISFRVKDDAGEWSDDYIQDIVVEPNEEPYVEDYTEEVRSDTDTEVVFKVRYTDAENDRPTSAKLVYSLEEQIWEEFLEPEDPYDEDYTDGRDYYIELKIVEAGTYDYWFEFVNENNGKTQSTMSSIEIEHTEAVPGPGAALLVSCVVLVGALLWFRRNR